MYHLANECSRRPSIGPVSFAGNEDPTAVFPSITGTGSPFVDIVQGKAKSNTKSYSERERLLRELQTSSISNLRLNTRVLVVEDDDEVEEKSMHSMKSVQTWLRRTRENLQMASKKNKRQLQLNPFRWGKKQDKSVKYDQMRQSQLAAFFESESRDKTNKSRFSRGTTHDQDDAENKSVASQRSLPSFLRPGFAKKKMKERTRRLSLDNSFTAEEFSVEVQEATTTPRPTLNRQGSSFIRRLLRPKHDLKVPASNSWSGSDLAPFPDRFTPTTADASVSDNEEYENEGVEKEWEEKVSPNDYESDDGEDEEIASFSFRPIEPHDGDAPRGIVDRWSPSPSPSLEHESAPRKPMRSNEEADCPPKLPASRKTDSIVYPAPSPIRAKPKKSWSSDSIRSLFGNWKRGKPETKGILKGTPKKTASRFAIRAKPPRRSVSFDSVVVREYERVVCDNPACAQGPPISIGWCYQSEESTPLEEYEHSKLRRTRTKGELCLSADHRSALLFYEWEVRKEELEKAEMDAHTIQRHREDALWDFPMIRPRRRRRRRRKARKPSLDHCKAVKPSADHSDTSQPSLRRETAERAARYSPTPEIMRLRSIHPSAS